MQSISALAKCLILGFLAVNLGCAKTQSENVKTSGIYVSYSLQGNSAGAASCSVTFQVGGGTGTYLELSGGDSVTCNGQSMSKNEVLGIVTYTSSVSYSPGSTYTVRFQRPSEAPYVSTVSLPDPIVVQSPAMHAAIKKGTVLPVQWVKSNTSLDRMSVRLSFDIVSAGVTNSHSFSKTDGPVETGFTSFTAAETSPVLSTGPWSAKVNWHRYRYGSMPSGLDGHITASQSTEVPVQLVD